MVVCFQTPVKHVWLLLQQMESISTNSTHAVVESMVETELVQRIRRLK